MHRTKILDGKIWKMGKRHLGGHDLVRKIDKQGEILVRCRKCSGCARQRMGPKMMNRARLEQEGTREHGKMLNKTQFLEDGKSSCKGGKNRKNEGQKGE